MSTSFQCPNCSGPIAFEGRGLSVPCPYCGTTVIVPEELRPQPSAVPESTQVLDLSEIMAAVRAGRKIEAIKLYRVQTGLGLKESKDAVERLEAAGWDVSRQTAIGVQVVSGPAQDGTPSSAQQVNVPLLVGILTVFLVAIVGMAIFLFNMDGPAQSLAPIFQPTQTPIPFAHSTLAFGSEGAGAGYLDDARSVAADAKGRIFVGDYSPGRIQAFSADGAFLWQYLTPGDTDYVISLAAGLDGRLYAVVGRGIEVLEAETGKSLARWEPADQFIGYYQAIAVTPQGEVLAVMERELVKFSPQGDVLLHIGGVEEDFLKLVGVKDGSVRITGMAVSGSGDIYISTSGGYILKLSENGVLVDRLTGEKTTGVDAISVDGQGRIAWGYAYKIVLTDGEGRRLGDFDAPYMRDMEFNLKGQLIALHLSAPLVRVYSFRE